MNTVLFGSAVQGLEESNLFMDLAWVKAEFASKLGFIPFPGTFNLEIRDEDSLARWRKAKKNAGIAILPGEEGFCSARCYPVTIEDKIHGAIVLPEVPGYPDSKLEIIAPRHVRADLGLHDGDRVKVEIIGEEE